MSKPSTKQIARVIAKKRLTPAQIAGYLVQQRRTRDLTAIMRELANIRAEQGVLEATVISAHPLAAATEQAVTQLILGQHKDAKKLILDKEVDPAVVGGISVATDQIRMDSTVHGRLNRLKQTERT